MPSTSPNYTLRNKRVWVAGHRGLVGGAIVRRLQGEGCEILTAPRETVDLRRPEQVERWMASVKPHAVFLAAAKVGGIYANDTRPAEFIYDNLMVQGNVVEASRRLGVEKLMLLGSSCIYPRLAPQPIAEEALLSGPLEPTNEWYAVAKIAGIKLCQAYRRQHGADFISVLPSNVYGPGDNYHPQNSHVIAGLMRRFHDAKSSAAPRVTVWGTGTPKREFIYVDDLADACVLALERYSAELPLNIGAGTDLSIAELARLIAEVVGYRGELVFDPSKPDGTPRKLLDITRLRALGFSARTPLRAGLERAYADFVARHDKT
jgi:GDP-L-fucose synthase